MYRMCLTQAGFGIDRLDPHRMHQPRHAFVIHVVALAASPGGHPPHAIIRCGRILLIQQTHQREILCTLPLSLIVIGRPGQPDQVTLPRDTNLRMRLLNQLPLRLRW
jgi:hypothetical protein